MFLRFRSHLPIFISVGSLAITVALWSGPLVSAEQSDRRCATTSLGLHLWTAAQPHCLADGAPPAYAAPHDPDRAKPLPVATTPMATSSHHVYLPIIQRQQTIPGALSLPEVYTADYDGVRQSTFRPCQAVTLSVHLKNASEIPQIARLYWETRGPDQQTPMNLQRSRQVTVPPGTSAFRLEGSADLGTPAGEYQFKVGFTSGMDRVEMTGALTIAGEPISMRLLAAHTATIDPLNYDLVVPRLGRHDQERATVPVRITDGFTFKDSDVVQLTTWEGATEDTYVKTSRFRPDGRRWGNFRRAWLDYEDRPGCLRTAVAYWPIDDFVKETPGRWRLDIYGGPFGDEAFATTLYYTLQARRLPKSF